jgi:post-segregation antitoxin (ccd killing protein)
VSEHILKTDLEVFEAVIQGKKTYEIRYNDRGYKVGDTLILKETKYTGREMKDGMPLIYTDREYKAKVSHILQGPCYGLAEGWVILSLDADLRAKLEAAETELEHMEIVADSKVEVSRHIEVVMERDEAQRQAKEWQEIAAQEQSKWGEACKEVVELQGQVEVMRGALEFYADDKNYQSYFGACSEVYNDEGENARDALQSTPDSDYIEQRIKTALQMIPGTYQQKVYKLAELLQDAVSETKNGEKLSDGFITAAEDALAKWKGGQ